MNNNYLKFNNLGILVDSTLNPVSQGNNNVDYYYVAYDVYDYTNGFVTISVTLPDGTIHPELATSPKDFEFKGGEYKGFFFKLSETLTALSGNLTITINLISAENDTQLCSSQVTIPISKSDTHSEPTITEEQYHQMQEIIRENHEELIKQYESTWEKVEEKIEQEGLKGEAATIKLGSVATGNAGTEVIITNTGNENNAVFNFVVPRGDKGDKGDKGDRGLQGIQGIQGEQGVAGPTGPKGDKGDKGESGTSFVITGEVDNISLLPTLDVEDIGTAYFVGTTIPKDVYLWGYKNGVLQWINQGALQGPQGERGPIGETGPIGPTGPQGIQGETGPQGEKGETGEVPSDYVRCVDAIVSPEPGIDPLDNYYKKPEVDNKIANFTTREYVDTGLGLKQNKLTAGDNINIANNVISANKPLKKIYSGESFGNVSLSRDATISGVNFINGNMYIFETDYGTFMARSINGACEIKCVTNVENTIETIGSYYVRLRNNGSNLIVDSASRLSYTVTEEGITDFTIGGNNLVLINIYEMEVE